MISRGSRVWVNWAPGILTAFPECSWGTDHHRAQAHRYALRRLPAAAPRAVSDWFTAPGVRPWRGTGSRRRIGEPASDTERASGGSECWRARRERCRKRFPLLEMPRWTAHSCIDYSSLASRAALRPSRKNASMSPAKSPRRDETAAISNGLGDTGSSPTNILSTSLVG